MVTAVETFDPTDAIKDADLALAARREDATKQLKVDSNVARDAAVKYAHHLTVGGDPTTPPNGGNRWRNDSSTIIPATVGLRAVYRNWNISRGSRNPIDPFSSPDAWKLAERLFERFGTPIPFAELKPRGRGSDAIQKVLVRLARETKCAIVPRRTKVDGKVAYYIRDFRDGDEDTLTDAGYYRAGGSTDIPEETP